LQIINKNNAIILLKNLYSHQIKKCAYACVHTASINVAVSIAEEDI